MARTKDMKRQREVAAERRAQMLARRANARSEKRARCYAWMMVATRHRLPADVARLVAEAVLPARLHLVSRKRLTLPAEASRDFWWEEPDRCRSEVNKQLDDETERRQFAALVRTNEEYFFSGPASGEGHLEMFVWCMGGAGGQMFNMYTQSCLGECVPNAMTMLFEKDSEHPLGSIVMCEWDVTWEVVDHHRPLFHALGEALADNDLKEVGISDWESLSNKTFLNPDRD